MKVRKENTDSYILSFDDGTERNINFLELNQIYRYVEEIYLREDIETYIDNSYDLRLEELPENCLEEIYEYYKDEYGSDEGSWRDILESAFYNVTYDLEYRIYALKNLQADDEPYKLGNIGIWLRKEVDDEEYIKKQIKEKLETNPELTGKKLDFEIEYIGEEISESLYDKIFTIDNLALAEGVLGRLKFKTAKGKCELKLEIEGGEIAYYGVIYNDCYKYPEDLKRAIREKKEDQYRVISPNKVSLKITDSEKKEITKNFEYDFTKICRDLSEESYEDFKALVIGEMFKIRDQVYSQIKK